MTGTIGIMSSSILTLDRGGWYLSFDRSHLFVADCLPSTERSVRLKDDIQDIINASEHRNQTQYYGFVIDSASSLIDHLDHIAEQFESFQSSNGLILHIEAHGKNFESSTSDAGIEVGDSHEFVHWSELQPSFSRLYCATQGRLTLVVSACWGYTALASVLGSLVGSCAPFRYLVAPAHSATNFELDTFWRKFYSAVYDDMELQGLLETHSNFSLLPIEKFLATYALGTDKEPTDEETQARLAEESIFKSIDVISSERGQHGRQVIRDFLLIDRYPRLLKEMDVRDIGTILKDHDMILANARDENWKTS